MMKPVLFYIMCLCLLYLKHAVRAEDDNPKLNNYLKNKSEKIEVTFLEKLRSVVEGIDAEELARNRRIPENYKKTFSVFNDTFLVTENQLHRVLQINGTTVLQRVKDIFYVEGHIIFTRVIEYGDTAVFIVKTEVEIDVYTIKNSLIYFKEALYAPYASDINLYINQNTLYMIVVDNNKDNLAISRIYRWTGSSFDESESLLTTGSSQVTSFTNNFIEIIIILQNFPRSNMLSTVYEFNFGKLKKIQHITTTEPEYIDVYKTKVTTYVLISEKSKNNLIYAWDGSKLVKMFQFQTEIVVNKSITLTTNDTSFLAIPLKNKIQIFYLRSKEMKLVGEINTNFSTILDIHMSKAKGNITYIVGLNKNNTLSISAMSIKINFTKTVIHDSKETVRNCFNNLEFSIFKQTKKLKEAKEMLQSQIKISGIKNSKNNTPRTASIIKEDSDIKNNYNDLRIKLNKVQQLLSKYQETEDNNIIINNKTTIKGSLEAVKLTGKNVNFNKINNHTWEPQNWLKYKQTQNISGPITIEKITAAEVNTSDSLFTDLLKKNGDQDIWGSFKIKNLTVSKINTKKINDVQVTDIYQKSDPQPIAGLKIFDNLKTKEAQIKQLNGQSMDILPSFNTNKARSVVFDNNLEVENLIVETIDNIDWNNFKNSVFRIGITKEINGDLTLSEFKANNITLQTLKGINVADLLTTSTDQVIEADIEVKNIFAENITTNTTNGINLSQSAVQLDESTLVEGLVKLDKLNVKNLELVGELNEELFLKNGEHIIGTNESDLWQKYEGVVKIKGNLYLENITLQPKAKLFILEEEFDPNITEIYWTKNTTQSIPIQFKAKKGLTVPHLLTDKINGINFNQYMFNNDIEKFETDYYFENISIIGDVFLNSKVNNTPNLTKLKEDAVMTTGSFYINGKKTYQDTLRVEDLITPILGGIVVNETLNRESTVNVTGKNTFKKIIIKGNLTCNMENLAFINGINITHLLENAIYIDRPQNLEKLNFKNITVENLFVSKLNNHNVRQYIQNVEKVLAASKINKLSVNGNVVLKNVVGLSKINGIEFDKLLNNTLKKGKRGGYLINLEFLGPVAVNDLITNYINDVNLKKLSKRLLYKNITQNITALYSFHNIKTENLVVSKINNISTENLIDVTSVSPQTIYAPKGIEFNSAIFQKSLSTKETSPCNLVQALKNFTNPPTRKWHTIEVKGNVSFLDSGNILYRVFENAVTTNSKNIIRAPVRFSKHVMAERVTCKQLINNINLLELLDDAVLRDTEEEQIITGFKVFRTMTIQRGVIMKNTDIPVVNGIDIPELNKAIVRKNKINDYAIKGKKTFAGGLKCNKLYTQKLFNTDVENIVSTVNSRKIPQSIFDSIEVENNLNISAVNSFDFDEFLKNRLLIKGLDTQSVNGIYYFDNIEVEHMKTQFINKIKIDDVVFDIDEQSISSPKHFTQAIEVFGNLTCENVNGVSISEMYKKSIVEDEVTIDGSLTILRPSIVKGSITTEYINGYPVEQIKKILDQGTIRTETEKIYGIHKDIIDKIRRNIHHVQFLASDYMYIEKTQALQISVPNTASAKTMDSNGYLLMHVNGEESGNYCHLSENCKCPVQYTIEVSPEHSVSTILNKELQRIFTYRDNDLIIHFSTNSISTDSTCRRDSANVINEVSMMSWNILPTSNSTGGFFVYEEFITGYISGAEFFTLHGQTYAIIGRYYDAVQDSHDLDCYLIRFTQDKTKAEVIQKIPTKGAWSISLFYTAQGVTLIIGNIIRRNTHQGNEATLIYRFIENTQQFNLLRIVPSYGCSMATGVVLGTDSLIILAHRYAPLQVLKYYPDFDNYYFYQSFELEAPVIGISVFYTGGFGISDAYLCTVTENESYFIYSFRYIEGWKLESSGELDGLRNLIPFNLNKQLYLFAPSTKNSSLLTVVKHGSV